MMRQRSHNSESSNQYNDQHFTQSNESVPFMMDMSLRSGSKNSAGRLLALNPSKYGYADKQDNSWKPVLFPCWYPKFKRRFFILIGNFLYRFVSDEGESPKGIPIPLDSMLYIKSLEDTMICITLIRKSYTLRFSNPNERNEWLQAIKDRKALAIREEMGHVKLDPEIRQLNQKASKMLDDRNKEENLRSKDTLNPLQFPG